VGFEARERIAQAARQNDLRVIVAFGGEFARRDVGTMPEGVAEFAQPSERGVLDDRFGECGLDHCTFMRRVLVLPVLARSKGPDGLHNS
jgi:hypothetical protein